MPPGEPQAARDALDRVLSSPGFARNPRMSQFLRFLVDRHLAGRDGELKESVIAVEVFGRRPDYDPKLDSIVRTEAARLRARLAEYYAGDGADDEIVLGVPKGGYVPAIRRARSAPRPRRLARPWLAALATLALAAAVVVPWRLSRPAAGGPARIAVLPLEDLNPAGGHAYVVDGLTDEIIRNLSLIEGLSVRSRTSSFALKGQPRNIRQAARQLGADYLVEGSVLLMGDQLRINVQLVRANDDLPVWSSRYDRQLADVFAVQDEISRGIVNELRLRLGGGRRRYETNIDAYTRYLDARAQSLRGMKGILQSIDTFEQAIAKDPSFAPAYAGLASAYAIRSTQFPVDHPADELARMRAAAERAIELDPLLAEAHAALGLALARDAEWSAAEARFRRAIQLEPGGSRALTDFAMWHLHVLGRNEEALGLLRQAEAVDPLSPEVHTALAWVLFSLSRFQEGAAHCLAVHDEYSLKSLCLARADIGNGHVDAAVQRLVADAAVAENPHSRGLLGYALARTGRRDRAAQMAAASRFPNEQALIYAGLDDKGRAFEALERMGVVGVQRLGQYLNYPELASLRSDARFDVLRRQVFSPR